MKIKFKAPDPRAGSVAQLDSRLAQQFIDSGAADRVSEEPVDDQTESAAVTAAPRSKPNRTPRAGKK